MIYAVRSHLLSSLITAMQIQCTCCEESLLSGWPGTAGWRLTDKSFVFLSVTARALQDSGLCIVTDPTSSSVTCKQLLGYATRFPTHGCFPAIF